MGVRILAAGPLLLLQDAGRAGHAALGVGASGALDQDAYGLANRLVGNPPGAAALELLLGPASFEFTAHAAFAVTGAVGPVTLDGRKVPLNRLVKADDGGILKVRRAERGLRYYLAVRGGFTAKRLLGSLSTDTLSGLGPEPLRDGDVLSLMNPAGMEGAGTAEVVRLPSARTLAVRVSPGPRLDWYRPGSWRRLLGQDWTVTPDSNRIGIRLGGQPLERTRPGELPPEGMAAGALQVPPSGMPTIFLADHPVTGGYPVVGVVHSKDLSLLAQARPGQKLRFLNAERVRAEGGSPEDGVGNREDSKSRQ